MHYINFNSNNITPFIGYYEPVLNPIHSFYRKLITWGISTFAEWLTLAYLSFFMIIFSSILIIALFEFIYSDLGLITSFIPGISLYIKKGNIIKLRNVAKKYKWEDLEYKVNNHTFSNVLFKSLLNRFWSKIENQFTDNNHMFILFKIKYITGETLSIGNLQRLNKEDKT